jgi:hypothetical protein
MSILDTTALDLEASRTIGSWDGTGKSSGKIH